MQVYGTLSIVTTVISSTEARRTLFGIIDAANDDCEVYEIVGKRGRVFLVPEEEYRGWAETEFLMRGRNGEVLLDSIANSKAGVNMHQYDSWDALDADVDKLIAADIAAETDAA